MKTAFVLLSLIGFSSAWWRQRGVRNDALGKQLLYKKLAKQASGGCMVEGTDCLNAAAEVKTTTTQNLQAKHIWG